MLKKDIPDPHVLKFSSVFESTVVMEGRIIFVTFSVLGIASIVGADRPVLIPSTHPVYKAAGHSWNVTCVANQSIVWEWGGPEQVL